MRVSLVCSAKTSQDPVYFVAKCGYECWPKYGDTKSKESSNSLNDFEAGELRGCMEYCVRREMDSESQIVNGFGVRF